MIDAVDRRIVNDLQSGLPISPRPYADAAAELGLTEAELIERLARLRDSGVLTRFGPLWNAEKLGGALTLCAMAVPEADFERVAEIVNGFDQVAHNYARDHALNMWFVLATEAPEEVDVVIAEIEAATDLSVLNMPKREEFFVGLRFAL